MVKFSAIISPGTGGLRAISQLFGTFAVVSRDTGAGKATGRKPLKTSQLLPSCLARIILVYNIIKYINGKI
jgi:hypothetical protein